MYNEKAKFLASYLCKVMDESEVSQAKTKMLDVGGNPSEQQQQSEKRQGDGFKLKKVRSKRQKSENKDGNEDKECDDDFYLGDSAEDDDADNCEFKHFEEALGELAIGNENNYKKSREPKLRKGEIL